MARDGKGAKRQLGTAEKGTAEKTRQRPGRQGGSGKAEKRRRRGNALGGEAERRRSGEAERLFIVREATFHRRESSALLGVFPVGLESSGGPGNSRSTMLASSLSIRRICLLDAL